MQILRLARFTFPAWRAIIVVSLLALQACGGSGGGTDGVPPTSAGTVSLVAGAVDGPGNLNGTSAAARFSFPSALALDAQGNLLVADGDAVRKVAPTGVVSTLAGPGQPGALNEPEVAVRFCGVRDVAVDPSGNVFVADPDLGVVHKITLDGAVLVVWGTLRRQCNARYSDELTEPTSVVADAQGNVYFADSFTKAVYKISPQGGVNLLAGGDASPNGGVSSLGFVGAIAVDTAGNVLVVDSFDHVIRSISPAGAVTIRVPASSGALDSQFGAGGIAVDPAGNIYVAVDQVIRKIAPSGAVSVLAGAVGQAGYADGPAASARFNNPGDVVVDRAGNVLIADTNNAALRKIAPDGKVTTLAGRPAIGPDFGSFHATDAAGNVYVVVQTSGPSSPRYAIQKIAPGGNVVTLTTELQSPRGIAVDDSGNVYVADEGRAQVICQPFSCGVPSVVLKISAQGVVSTLAGSYDSNPYTDADGTGSAASLRAASGLAIDRAGNLYLGQLIGGSIRKITPAGVVSTFAEAGQVNDVAVDAAGNVVALTCLYPDGPKSPTPPGTQIVRYDPKGVATVLAGSARAIGATDGPGAQASFGTRFRLCANGLTVDAGGTVLVADTWNSTVRRITPAGVVSTVVGQAGVNGITLGPLPATLSAPTDVSLDGAGNLYIGSAHAIVKVRFGN